MGNPALISLGPGTLRTAPLGSSEPADILTAWPAAWVQMGYTFEGSEFSHSYATENVEVAEELDPLAVQATGRTGVLKFVTAEVTATNLQRALNGGTITVGAGFVTFDPPSPTQLVYRMYGWESSALDERWIWRQCFAGGTMEVKRAKGAAKAGFSFELQVLKPSGVQPFRAIYTSARA